MPVYFTPPRVPEKAYVRHRLFSRVSVDQGVTVLKEDGFYRLARIPSAEECEAADAYYQGGRTYLVSDDEGDALTAAGYGAYLSGYSSGVFDPLGYGEGAYGTGSYGA